VAIVAECFLPEVNGVTNSVLRVLDHLEANGHEAVVICPAPAGTRTSRLDRSERRTGVRSHGPTPVVRMPSFALPMYSTLSVALPTPRLESTLRWFRPDVVHLAAPVVLGAAGGAAARRLGIPTVAVYQTDLAGFAGRYGLGAAGPAIWGWLRKVHRTADLTLAPSSAAAWALEANGITPVGRWGRGVDVEGFHPRHRSETWRRAIAPAGETIVGYVGRLAPEKDVHLLASVQDLPGTRLVIVGDGPDRARLQALLPRARFLGFQHGTELAQPLASLDLFVHTGAHETFCQTIQEAHASGVAVVAPAAGGPLDLVDHGRTGWLVPPDSPALLRGAVAALVRDPALRVAMGEAGRSAVAGRTWNGVCDQLLDHYRSVIRRPGARLAAA
jgi:phosphatidylinositol alpha 1,6-mannosyltransferase